MQSLRKFMEVHDISTHSLTKRLTRPHPQAGKQRLYFNSQPHEEADHTPNHVLKWIEYFNSQPHEEADVLIYCNSIHFTYFNSQPHEEADLTKDEIYTCVCISTHSLTKRLTLRLVFPLPDQTFQLTASRRG